MHFTGTIWRPPYDAWSALLEVTEGCTHHKCAFCTLYEDVPFKFRMSSEAEIVEDLKELSQLVPGATRLFLTGANPFVLTAEKLRRIAFLAKQHLSRLKTMGCFARITDIAPKSVAELKQLRSAGYNGITIGVETGDDDALAFMRKGYSSADILEQCRKLDEAAIDYNFFYLAGISGKGNGARGVERTLAIFNRLQPKIIGSSMLTVQPSSKLYAEMLAGKWSEESETEKYIELKTLIKGLAIPTHFAALGASNLRHMHGNLPHDRAELLAEIDDILRQFSEDELSGYRKNLRHL